MQRFFSKEIKTKDIKIEELSKEKQKGTDTENSKISDINNNKRAKATAFKYKKFEELQNDYDDIFNKNIKLKEDNTKLNQEINELKGQKEEYRQSLIDIKNITEENYKLKGKMISLNNDNVILVQRMKTFDEEKEKIMKGEKELKVRISELNVENRQKKEKIQELTEMVEMLKKEEEKQSNEKKEKNDLLKEIELLKSKCINYDKLILEKEKLAASLKEKEEEIKKLKEDAKTNNNKNEINIEQQKSEETNNNINSELQNKDDMINKLKEENEEIKEKLNNTRKKLTEIEGIYETKKLVLKKYYQDKEEIEKFKEEKNKMNEIIKKLRDQNNKLEKKIDVFRKKYQKQNEKDKTDE